MPSARRVLLLGAAGIVAIAAAAALTSYGGTPASARASAPPAVSRAAFPSWAHTEALPRAGRATSPSSTGFVQRIVTQHLRGGATYVLFAILGVLKAGEGSFRDTAVVARAIRALTRVLTPTPPPRPA